VFRQNSVAAVFTAGLSAVVPGAAAGTIAAVAGLLLMGTRLAHIDSLGVTFGNFKRQTMVAVGKV